MGFKTFFTGKTGKIFWLNIALMIVVAVAVPLLALQSLKNYTKHGEKIEVPVVVGQSAQNAQRMLEDKGLIAIVADSAYSQSAIPGEVLLQTPEGGSIVKSERVVYLTVNLQGEPMVKMPDLANNSSLREAEARLKALGFYLSPPEYVEGEQEGWVLGVKQGLRLLNAGEMVSRNRALTIVVGGGLEEDSLITDTLIIEEEEVDFDFDI
jgi:beta-lactam-binding protein with PASTA domain